jgi:hypothetical protein
MWQYATNSPPPTPAQIRIGDVVSPADINSADAIAVSKWLIFLNDMNNHTGEWRFDLDDGTRPIGSESLATRFEECNDLEVAVTGYLLGDVDFSWPNRNNKAQRAPIGFALETVRHDDTGIEVRLVADVRSQALENLVYSLRYDASQWEFERTSLDARVRDFVAMDNPAEAGVLHGLVLGAGREMNVSGAVASFQFRARTPQAGGRFAFDRLVANDQKSPAMPVLDLGGGSPATAAPRAFALSSAPNPFNPSTTVEYRVADGAGQVPVSLRVYDLAGRMVRSLVETTHGPGTYQAPWDGRDDAGRTVSTGVYLIQMRAGDWMQVHKTALVK